MRRGFWIAFWVVVSIVLGRGTLRRAAIRHAYVSGFSGAAPVYAGFSWSYGPGVRPISIIFDLKLADGAQASITTDGEALEAEVPFRSTAHGSYQLTATATYRLLGVVRTAVYEFSGQIA